jgi:hypothetical protein
VTRVGVTGSRDWTDETTVARALTAAAALAIRHGSTRLIVVHGTARGADELADAWVRRWADSKSLHAYAERHPANWSRDGRRAGYIRNEAMIRKGAQLWLAFLMPCTKPTCKKVEPHDSHGATHCAELARDAGIPLRVFRPGGEVFEYNFAEPQMDWGV